MNEAPSQYSRQTLIEVFSSQQEEALFFQQDPSILIRSQTKEAVQYLDRGWAVVITGVRRCGKSTFAHQVFAGQSYAYANFDDERLFQLGTKDLDAVLGVLLELVPNVTHFLFDEIQNIEGWELFINRLLRKKYKIVVTGSNSKLLSRELATHLTGRSISIELFPFSFKEVLEYRKIDTHPKSLLDLTHKTNIIRAFNLYLQTGGFPEIIQKGFTEVYLREIFSRIISRDIVDRYRFRESRSVKEVALFAFSNASQKLTYQKTAKSLGIKSVTSVKKYLGAIEEAYLLQQVSAFDFKVKEILRKAKKIYPIDLGMLNAISLKSSHDFGLKLETFVFQQLRRHSPEVYYFEQSKEVDFLLRTGRTVEQLIQVSLSIQDEHTRKREVDGLLAATKLTGCRNMLLITQDEEQLPNTPEIRCIPAWKWALEAGI